MVAAKMAATMKPSIPCGRTVSASDTNAASEGFARSGHIVAMSGNRIGVTKTGVIHRMGISTPRPAHHSAILRVSRSSGTL